MKAEIDANLSRADESLAAAKSLVESKFYDDGCSRAYYAAFYAATAALLSGGWRFSKHAGVINGVHQHLVKTGRLTTDLGRDLNWLFDLRLVGDYGETLRVPAEKADEAIEVAERLVRALKSVASEDPVSEEAGQSHSDEES